MVLDHYCVRTCAVVFFRVTTARFLPAAAWYVPIFCVRFFRATRGKTAHDWKGAHRSAEGTTRQLRKSYVYELGKHILHHSQDFRWGGRAPSGRRPPHPHRAACKGRFSLRQRRTLLFLCGRKVRSPSELSGHEHCIAIARSVCASSLRPAACDLRLATR